MSNVIGRAGPVILASLALAGCASIQLSAGVQRQNALQGSGGVPGQNVPLPIAAPPGPLWPPEDIVRGFLAASASFTGDHAAARLFLAPGVTWNPGRGATVVSQEPQPRSVPFSTHAVGGQPEAEYVLTGRPIATLTDSGQYLLASREQTFKFTLEKTAAGWRIIKPPATLLLTEPYFLHVYQPANLYFYAKANPQVLVPDPVFIPQELTAAQRASRLIAALGADPVGWLAGTALTAFPAQRRAGNGISATVRDGIATVSLRGAIGRAPGPVLQRMAAQLVLTLTSTSYSSPGIRAVRLTVNDDQWRGGTPIYLRDEAFRVPQVAPGRPAYFQVAGGVEQLSAGKVSGRLPLPPSLQPGGYTAIAVSPGGTWFAGCQHKSLYISMFRRSYRLAAPLQLRGNCSWLSWDTSGNLWAGGGSEIWLVRPGSDVIYTVLNLAAPPSQTVTDLRVSPDGTRVAMVVRGPNGVTQVDVAAISRDTATTELAASHVMTTVGAGIPDPQAVSWLDPDHLIVLSSPGAAAPQLYETPVNGGTSVAVGPPPGAVSVSAAGALLVTGTKDGQIWVSAGIQSPPTPVAKGSTPVFPG